MLAVTFFGSLLAGIPMCLALYIAARYVSQKDPQLIRIMLRSAGARPLYDPGKLDAIVVERGE